MNNAYVGFLVDPPMMKVKASAERDNKTALPMPSITFSALEKTARTTKWYSIATLLIREGQTMLAVPKTWCFI